MNQLAFTGLLVLVAFAACSAPTPGATPATLTPSLTVSVAHTRATLPITVTPTQLMVRSSLATSPTPGVTRAPTLRSTPAPTIATATPVTQTLRIEQHVGTYTIRLWHPAQGLYDHATISQSGQPEVYVEAVQALGQLPAVDITGEGDPEILFETYQGGSHCCWGTVVYSLGPAPVKILDINSTPDYYGDGRGTFQDIDGDGQYEFITHDALSGIPCSAPTVQVILRYEPGRGYVGASPYYAKVYADEIAANTRQAETNIEKTHEGYKCDVYPVIVAYLYSGQTARARSEMERLYQGADRSELLDRLEQSVKQGRFYIAATTP